MAEQCLVEHTVLVDFHLGHHQVLLDPRVNLADETPLHRGIKKLVVKKAIKLRLASKVVKLSILDNDLVDLFLIQELRSIERPVEVIDVLWTLPKYVQLAGVWHLNEKLI